jgi:hypothetical protein
MRRVCLKKNAHYSAMLGCIGERLSLKSFSTQSVPVFSFHDSGAVNLLSHRYVVAKGISVLTARFAKAGYSECSPIQNSVSGF